jgi:hypothetical protein
VETDPVGLLLIRAWMEHGSEQSLRAEVKFTCDTTRGFELALTLSDPEAVVAAVEAWLAEMVNACG